MSDFAHLKARLNPEQAYAVETIEGPVMVMAGPGTGKTQVLAARIAQILQETDTQPYQILALTFTESAATTMRRRLVSMIGRTGYYVQIMTFHAFCSGVMQEHPEAFKIDTDAAPLSDVERFEIFETLFNRENLGLNVLKPLNAPYLYLKKAISSISDLKREDVSPDDFQSLIDEEVQYLETQADELKKAERIKQEKNIAKHKELLVLYREYQQELLNRKRYDFDDMIALVAQAFDTNEALLLEYQEQLQYFLVDEYQDTNAAQNRVVDTLASHWGDQANIFVVGDPNQAIYRFQGASVENALGFVDRYPTCIVITLTQGYRCPQPIYDAAAGVIEHNQLSESVSKQFPRISEPLESQKQNGSQSQKAAITIKTAQNETIEIWSIVTKIQSLIESGVPAQEIAVLYRTNAQALSFQLALSRRKIAYDIEGGDNVLHDERIRQFLTLLKVIHQLRPESRLHEKEDPHELFEVLSYDWVPVENHIVYELARIASTEKISILSALEQQEKTSDLPQIELQTVLDFVSILRSLGQDDYNMVLTEWFVKVLAQSGYKPWIMAQDEKIEHLINIQSIFAQVKELCGKNKTAKLADLLHMVSTMQEHSIAIPAEDFSTGGEAITLSTVHKAKGREWQYVFVAHCVNGSWGNSQKRELLALPDGVLKNTQLDDKEKNEDDRRLFYVAITRASQAVTISYAQTQVKGSRSVETIPSMFVEEMRALDKLAIDEETIQPPNEAVIAELEDNLSLSGYSPLKSIVLQREKDFFKKVVTDFSLSVTALNAYLRDPQEFVMNSLLRVPRAKEGFMGFGTAMHAALEYGFKHLHKTEILTIQEVFERALRKELLTDADYDRWLIKGKEVLAGYFAQVQQDAILPFQLERSFGSGKSQTVLGDIRLTGRIDRIDWLDTEKGLVKVIDYKTGSPKSANYIEGKVASMGLSERELSLPEPIRGPYKRQLLFYKLLTQLDESFKPEVTHGCFDFVEPNPSGKLVSASFELSQEDVDLLSELIQQVMQEIRSLQFLN